MKRIIARFGVNGDGLEKESPNSAAYNAYIGRQLSVGSQSVVVEEIIAEGGYGVVFKVRNFSHKYYALKRLCVNSEEDLVRSKQEMTLLRQFQHKNIVRLVDAGISRNQSGVYEVYMLLQYCRGTVRELVNKTIANRMDIPEGTIMKIFCDICEAVGCLHEKNVIHRDLKIENILIDDNGNYVLCDFGSATAESLVPRAHGIAKTEEEITKYTTLAYRAPEMVDLYNNVEITTKADIWALGCLLYTLSFLKLPFKDSLLAIQSGEYSVPDDSIYSQNLRKLIAYMLRPDPKQRPDIYQVSILAFQLQGHCRSPLRNPNNSAVPKFENLSLPKTESDVKVKSSSALTSSPAPNPSEPVKTSVAPRQRPRGAGLAAPLGASPLPGPPSGANNGVSPPTPSSLPPPPGEAARARTLKEPSTSLTSTETSASSIQTSPLLIDVGGGDTVVSPLCAVQSIASKSSDVSNGLPATDASPDLLSFDSPTTAVPPLPTSAPAFPTPPFSFSCPRARLALPTRPAGHRRLFSDTSAVAQFGANAPIRPLVSTTMPPRWAAQPPRFSGPLMHQPLKASCSMDFIGGGGGGDNGLAVPSVGGPPLLLNYQLPPAPNSASAVAAPQPPIFRPRPPQLSGAPMAVTARSSEEPYVNPHHQWQQPLRGNRQLSSSSADLINLSGSVYTSMMPPGRPFGMSPAAAPASVGASAPTADGLRATSALELDAFGSVPFSSTPPLVSSLSTNSCDAIPPRPHPIQGHTRSASHGQCFRRP